MANGMKYLGWAVLIIFALLIFSVLGRACNWAGKAADVAMHEVDPAYLLKKYEWFKNASSALDKSIADLKVYDARVKSLEADYKELSRAKWAREDREQLSVWRSEAAGIAANYNSIAADYNAQMSKINWAFTNIGSLPKGASEPLPREYKPYNIGQ